MSKIENVHKPLQIYIVTAMEIAMKGHPTAITLMTPSVSCISSPNGSRNSVNAVSNENELIVV